MAINNYIYKINSKRNIIKYFEELFWMWYYIHTLNNPKDKLRVINQSQYFKDSMYKFIHSLFPKYTVIRIPAVGIPYSNPQYYDIPLGSIVNIWTGDLDELPANRRQDFEELGLSLHNNLIKFNLFMENYEKLSYGEEVFFNENIAGIPGAYYLRATKIFIEDQKEWNNE